MKGVQGVTGIVEVDVFTVFEEAVNKVVVCGGVDVGEHLGEGFDYEGGTGVV